MAFVKQSILVVTLVSACQGAPAARSQAANAVRGPKAPEQAAPRGPIERVALADVIAEPERYLDRQIVVQGSAKVCPGLCDGIKFICGSVVPSRGPCEGYLALASDGSSQLEVQCAGGSHQTQNALPLNPEDERHVCRGHCGAWACPSVELGRSYEATGALHAIRDPEGAHRYALFPDRPLAVATPD